MELLTHNKDQKGYKFRIESFSINLGTLQEFGDMNTEVKPSVLTLVIRIYTNRYKQVGLY